MEEKIIEYDYRTKGSINDVIEEMCLFSWRLDKKEDKSKTADLYFSRNANNNEELILLEEEYFNCKNKLKKLEKYFWDLENYGEHKILKFIIMSITSISIIYLISIILSNLSENIFSSVVLSFGLGFIIKKVYDVLYNDSYTIQKDVAERISLLEKKMKNVVIKVKNA